MATATWIPVTYLPLEIATVTPRLIAAGALEIQCNIKPRHQPGPTDPDPLLSADTKVELAITVSVLWPDGLEMTPDDVLRCRVPGPLG